MFVALIAAWQFWLTIIAERQTDVIKAVVAQLETQQEQIAALEQRFPEFEWEEPNE